MREPLTTGSRMSNGNGHPGNGPAIYLIGRSGLDRLAYRRLLEVDLRCAVSVESGFAPTSVWAAMRTNPELVLVEADRPQSDVVDAVQMITRLRPQAHILVISAGVEPALVEPWSRCTLHGYIVKDGGLVELRAAVDAMVDGKEYFSAGIREALTNAAASPEGAAKLSRRELDLLPLLARGMTLRDAASQMSISYKTADSYRTNLLRKLGVRDRVELARYAIRKRIIDP